MLSALHVINVERHANKLCAGLRHAAGWTAGDTSIRSCQTQYSSLVSQKSLTGEGEGKGKVRPGKGHEGLEGE
jgi:hypothetical protein